MRFCQHMMADQKSLYFSAYISQILLKTINNCKRIHTQAPFSFMLSSGCDWEVEQGSNKPAHSTRHARKVGGRTPASLQRELVSHEASQDGLSHAKPSGVKAWCTATQQEPASSGTTAGTQPVTTDSLPPHVSSLYRYRTGGSPPALEVQGQCCWLICNPHSPPLFHGLCSFPAVLLAFSTQIQDVAHVTRHLCQQFTMSHSCRDRIAL